MTMVSAGEVSTIYNMLLQGTEDDSHGDESATQVRVDAADKFEIAHVLFHFPAKQEGEQDVGEEGVSDKGSSSGFQGKNVPPAPEWLQKEGWKLLEYKVPMQLKRFGERFAAAYVYGKDIQAGSSLRVKGSGTDFVTFTLIKQVSPARPDPVKRLLLREPGLLVAWDNVALLMKSLRAELGDSLARHVLATGAVSIPPIGTGIAEPSIGSGAAGSARAPWPKLCQQGSPSDIQAWVFEHKLDALTSQLGGQRQCARQVLHFLVEQKAHVKVLQMEERCTALRTVMGVRSVSDVLAKLPILMAQEASVLHTSLKIIERYLPPEDARKHLRTKPMLAMQPEGLSHLFIKVNEKYGDSFIHDRLHERTSGEWIQWPDMVGKPDSEIVTWVGRIAVEERELSAKSRVQSFGSEAYGAAAIADARGMLPEIPEMPQHTE